MEKMWLGNIPNRKWQITLVKKQMNKKIKKVFDKMDPEIQEAVKFLINEIMVKRELKKLEKSENKA
jgi:hypothetical protein